MDDRKDPKKGGTAEPDNKDSCEIQYIREGDLCPNCRFAKLKKEPGNIIKCPICGWGTSDRCT